MPESPRRPTRGAQELRTNATDAERRLWAHLSRRQLSGFKFSRQMPVGPYICDFVCRERGLVVELDGGQHAEQVRRDSIRTAYLKREGLTVIRFWNNDVLGNTDGVLQIILAKLKELRARFRATPLLLAGGEEARSAEGVGRKGEKSHDSPTPQPPPASGWGLL